MTQVNANATGNPFHQSNGESGASTGTSVPGVRSYSVITRGGIQSTSKGGDPDPAPIGWSC